MTQKTTTITTYQCDLCGYESSGADFYLPEYDTTVEIKPLSMLDVDNNPYKINAGLTTIKNYVVLTEADDFLMTELGKICTMKCSIGSSKKQMPVEWTKRETPSWYVPFELEVAA